MDYQEKIGYLNDKLGIVPEIMYHGRIGTDISNEEMFKQIIIYITIKRLRVLNLGN